MELRATEAIGLQLRLASMKSLPATDADRDAIWGIFPRGRCSWDTYALDPNISRQDALRTGLRPTHTYVANKQYRSCWHLYLRP